ncbi:hypothetical protein GS498_20380 [Rhodococcus hoagii]|nr:hypothetical protein [Prescottella equi]
MARTRSRPTTRTSPPSTAEAVGGLRPADERGSGAEGRPAPRRTRVRPHPDSVRRPCRRRRPVADPDDARRFMQDMNRSFVTDPAARAGFAQLLTDLANTAGPQVYHCTAGKDRTGWTSALLQSIAGVSGADIMSDYLLTNEYTAASMERTYEGIKASRGQAVADIYRPLLGVDAGYLQAGLDELAAKYGSVQNYLLDGLDLSPVTIAKLRIKLFA